MRSCGADNFAKYPPGEDKTLEVVSAEDTGQECAGVLSCTTPL